MSKRSRSARRRRNLWIVAILFAVFSLAGFLVVPPVVRAQLEQRLTEMLGRTVTVGKVRFNPYTLALTVEHLDVQRKDRTGSFAGWDRLYVNFDALASLGGDWVLHAIELDGFHVGASIEPDGTLNFADILDKLAAGAKSAPPAAEPKPARPLRIGSLKVADARVEFADRSRHQPFATVLGPLSFRVTEFRTVSAERGAPYQFAAVTESGERLEWTGTLSADPFRSQGELRLEQIMLSKYAAYYADKFAADLADGRLSVRGKYEINFDPRSRVLRLVDGGVSVQNLKLVERAGGQTALELPAFSITGVSFDALKFAGSVGGIRATGGKVAVRRDADGSLNWLKLLPPPAAPDPAVTPATPAPVPEIRVAEVALQDFQVSVEDLATPRPAKLALNSLQFSLRDASLADGAVMPLQLGFDWAPEGKVSVAGTVKLKPAVEAELKADLRQFTLLPLSPYLEQQLNARLAQGSVSSTQTIKLSLANGVPAVDYQGSVWLDHFGLVDGERQEELAGFAALELNGITARTQPALEAAVQEIALSGPYARAVVREDQSLNLAGLVRPQSRPPAEPAPATVTYPAAAPKVSVGGVKIDGGEFSFTDRSLNPGVRVALGQFGGTIGAMSSTNPARAAVDLRGSVDGVGPVAITGQLDPLGSPRFVDLRIEGRNVDLVPLSPYSGKFAGYELARGKLALAVKATVQGDELQSENVITLNQFTFGAPVESKDATALPVRLGVALLKDLDGNIVIDVPVTGRLSDPDLRIGRVVLRVIVNLLTKAAVSPFALLGSMFGGGGDDLAYQEFDPGLADLRPAERAKLDTMVKALINRPGLSLGLEGGFDGPADSFALRRLKLAQLVRARIWEEVRATNPNLPPPDRIQVTPEAYAAKLKQLFDERFPPGTQFGTPLPAAPAVVTPPPPPAGLVKRVIRFLTLAEPRERRAAEQENARRAAEHERAVVAAAATGLPTDEMAGRLVEAMEVTDDDLRALAEARAARVRDYLITEGRISADRLFLSQSKSAQKDNKGPRVFLTLQ